MTDSLVAFVQRRAGESLRAIAHYEQTDFDLLYHRDDLETETVTHRVATIHDNITWGVESARR